MANERRDRGVEKIKEVYAGDVMVPPEGYAFSDVMLETLFADVWTRDVLAMRDRRILLLGMIAAQGESMPFKIQAKAAIKRGELTADQVRECLIYIAHYCGYPRASGLLATMEEAIAEAAQAANDQAG